MKRVIACLLLLSIGLIQSLALAESTATTAQRSLIDETIPPTSDVSASLEGSVTDVLHMMVQQNQELQAQMTQQTRELVAQLAKIQKQNALLTMKVDDLGQQNQALSNEINDLQNDVRSLRGNHLATIPPPSEAPTSSPPTVAIVPTAHPTVTPTQCFTGTAEEVIEKCNGLCCAGTGACTGWGSHANTVCTNSCQGSSACTSLGEHVVVNSGSCNGNDACTSLGDGAIVEPEACVGGFACVSLGPATGASRILVEAGSCHGLWACGTTHPATGGSGAWATEGLRIGPSSCVGDMACTDTSTTVAQLEIGQSSCVGGHACRGFALDTTSASQSQVADIGDHSCVGENACREKHSHASVTAGLFLVADRACHGDDACYEPREI